MVTKTKIFAKGGSASGGKVKKETRAVKKPKIVKPKVKVEPKIEPEPELKPAQERYWQAIGRRKNSVAQVRLFTQGQGLTINEKPLEVYFSWFELQEIVLAPLKKMKVLDKFRISVKVIGGGLRGQAEAIRHGIARALVAFNPDFRKRLKKAGYLTRDPRMKERKKYGLKKARRAPQWQKR